MSACHFGAHLLSPDSTQFRLWAPEAKSVAVAIMGGGIFPMVRDGAGFFSVTIAVGAGTHYRYRVDTDLTVPDPASQAQSGDVHGDSVVVDHSYAWQYADWQGRLWHETVVYELHPGTFGGFTGITAQLPRLAALGITAIELMPIADFPGRHNWGYDGVLPYAPDAAYGTPDELKELIDTAHGLRLQIFLDVVYNHFGPDGNYLNLYASSFFQPDTHTPWGNAIDFHKPQVRQFFFENALYWLNVYRFDGLRFDAVHTIADKSFLRELAATIRDATPPGRQIHLILENEENDSSLLRVNPHEKKFDAQWSDDWHHCAHALLTGESDGYYRDFSNPAVQLARCLAEGFAYQGEPSAYAGGRPRGNQSQHLPPTDFVICLQNHDQIGNRAMGERLSSLSDPRALRAATALLLLTPQIPMLFMGEEWGETRPFLFFTDHNEDLGKLVRDGRRREFAHFAAFNKPETLEKIPDPNAVETFAASVPVPTENAWTEFYKTCLSLRHEKIIPLIPGCRSIDARALSSSAIRASWLMNSGAILTVATNFGDREIACEPGSQEMLFATNPFVNAVLAPFTTCCWLQPHG
jgi:maltooligosyltrehalose trehalohydrolase